MIRRVHVLAICAVAVATMQLAVAAPAGAAGKGAMALDCDPGAKGIQTSCHYSTSGSGATFEVQVDLTSAPAGGIQALETNIHFDDKVLDYLPAKNARDEFKWPDCVFAARAAASQLHGQIPLLGCTIGPTNGPKTKYTSGGPSKYTGPVIQVQMRCATNGTSKLTMPPKETDLIDAKNKTLYPAVSNASIACGTAKGGSSQSSSKSQANSGSTSNPKSAADCAGLQGAQLASCQALLRCGKLKGDAGSRCLQQAQQQYRQLKNSSATNANGDNGDSGGLSTGLVMLIVVGGLAALGGGAYLIRRRMARRG